VGHLAFWIVAIVSSVVAGRPAAGRSSAVFKIHMAMAIAAVTCVLATLAVFIIEPGPRVDFFPRD